MEEKLQRLKEAMNKSVFKEIAFSERQKSNVLAKINGTKEIDIEILQVLHSKRTGYEVSQALLGRGVKSFYHHEGKLYVKLHELEQFRLLTSVWQEGQKFYQISDKGRKLLILKEEKVKAPTILQESPEGGL